MSRIKITCENARRNGKKLFVGYLTVGDPSLALTVQLVEALVSAGVDMIELGIPFSDPVADGPVNQRAAHRALSRGVHPEDVFPVIRSIRQSCDVPLILFTYYNPVLAFGENRFLTEASAAGADGMLVVDLPPEEAGTFVSQARKVSLDTIFLVSPTTAKDRLSRIQDLCSGFLYFACRKDTTGTRWGLPPEFQQQAVDLRERFDLPICAGFGISDQSTAREAARWTDGFVVGSALGEIIEYFAESSDMVERVVEKVRAIRPDKEELTCC